MSDADARELAGNESRLRVFLSYSRVDAEFIYWLNSSLIDAAITPDYDTSPLGVADATLGISAQDAWWVRLQEMITAADVVVFVVSPDSARSPICDEEIAFAQALGKRIIPILYRRVDFARIPPKLSALNIKINFADTRPDGRAGPLQELVKAIMIDVEWVRHSTALTLEARRWLSEGRARDLLIRGDELARAHDVVARRPSATERVPDSVLEFLNACEASEREQREFAEVERERYLQLYVHTKSFLKEELNLREQLQDSGLNWAMSIENRYEILILQNLLDEEGHWHPRPAVHTGEGGAMDGYPSYFEFPCCGLNVAEYRDRAPSQIRVDGCSPLPEGSRHQYREQMNPFRSEIINRLHGRQGVDWDQENKPVE